MKDGVDLNVRMSLAGIATTLTAGLLFAAPALAHLERPSYWPNPAPDKSVTPAAGGEVPDARPLSSAVSEKGPGEVRVVCKEDSLEAARASIRSARTKGFRLRPSQPEERLSAGEAKALLKANRSFAKRCEFDSVQDAVTASGNNDRVVIMPGRYTEPESRAARTNDPKCNPSLLQEDQSGALTPSYEYQATCQNDQNLIYVQGRAVKGSPLPSPRPDRHGIPVEELGPCVRCNLQIEGSGAKPEDVILDGGLKYTRDPEIPGAKPTGYAKHVVMRTDRSDGFVGRNFLLRGALEHGFYTEETDGILLDRVKFFWAADYGHLSFTTDHNVVQNCDGYGSGDAVVYPGAAPQTGDFRDENFYPKQRYSTIIRRCDLHGSVLAYSGSMGNSVRVTKNNIYGTTGGIATDTLSAPGHPGYPADGAKIDHNLIYSNNLNLYTEDPPIAPLVGPSVGTGISWIGINDAMVTKNWIFDNWNHGAQLVAVPDQLAGRPEGTVDRQIHCLTQSPVVSTSCGNRFFENRMGQAPPGFKRHPALTKFGNVTGVGSGSRSLPNGVDFWWDEFPTNTGNCWYDNTGSDGTEDSVTGPGVGDPLLNPELPSNCNTSVGLGDVVKEAVLVNCSMWSDGETSDDQLLPVCYWFDTPAQPGTAAAAAQNRQRAKAAKAYAASQASTGLRDRLDEISDTAP